MDEPAPGQVYRGPDGLPALYVRTEDRYGKGAEHLFVVVRKRVVFQHWTATVPEEMELVIDQPTRADVRAALREVEKVERERDVLLKALRRACELLPRGAAEEVRNIYREGSL